mgnify:FL=1
MNVKTTRSGKVTAVKLLVQDRAYLESAQGLCAIIAKVLTGERAGELAGSAEKAVKELLDLLTAEPVKPMVSK